MAPLSTAARATRFEAGRRRDDSEALKRVALGNLARSRENLGQAQAEAERARRVEPLPSPWSALHWTEAYEALDATLVAVD